MSGTESFLLQGWPLHPLLHKEWKVCCFHVQSTPPRNLLAREMRKQAGNSMNLFMMTVELLYSLLYVRVSWIISTKLSLTQTPVHCVRSNVPQFVNLFFSSQNLHFKSSFLISGIFRKNMDDSMDDDFTQHKLLLKNIVSMYRGI